MSAADPVLDPPTLSGFRGIGRYIWWIDRAFERARASDKAQDDTRLRIFFVMALFTAAFLTLAGVAMDAALWSGLDKAGVMGPVAANARADLVDRNGQTLAMDLTHYGLYLNPKEVYDRPSTRAALLAAVRTISPARLDAALAGDKPLYYLAAGLAPEVHSRIHDLALPGISFQEEVGRAYPLGTTGAHVIGFASSDGQGLAGAERAFDKLARNAAVSHTPVVLSIDLRVQGALQGELQKAGDHFGVANAVGMVVNVRTGEILAMASYPAFDANTPGKPSPDNMVNHAAATVYEPGSVFKVFTLAMGLDAGVADVRTRFDVHTPLVLPGQIIHDYDKGDQFLPLWEVFTHSSNIGAAKLGVRAGPEVEGRYFRNFGLFSRAPSELLESAHPLIPARMSENAVATMAFGQSISVSPLALAAGMSSILNGGIYRPLTLRRLDPGTQPVPGQRVIKPSTSRTMLNLMRLNVTNGTGGFADVSGYRVGGKTGTATKLVHGRYDLGKRNLASFAGIFPTDGPLDSDRYYVLIMMNEPKVMPETGGFTTGGAVSAPIAGKVIARIGPLLGVARKQTTPPIIKALRDNVDPSNLTGTDP